jgi:hypothetical protein
MTFLALVLTSRTSRLLPNSTLQTDELRSLMKVTALGGLTTCQSRRSFELLPIPRGEFAPEFIKIRDTKSLRVDVERMWATFHRLAEPSFVNEF